MADTTITSTKQIQDLIEETRANDSDWFLVQTNIGVCKKIKKINIIGNDISDLNIAIGEKADKSHSHRIEDITLLKDNLDSKAIKTDVEKEFEKVIYKDNLIEGDNITLIEGADGLAISCNKIGDITKLPTTNKDDIVSSIVEINEKIQNTSFIKLQPDNIADILYATTTGVEIITDTFNNDSKVFVNGQISIKVNTDDVLTTELKINDNIINSTKDSCSIGYKTIPISGFYNVNENDTIILNVKTETTDNGIEIDRVNTRINIIIVK